MAFALLSDDHAGHRHFAGGPGAGVGFLGAFVQASKQATERKKTKHLKPSRQDQPNNTESTASHERGKGRRRRS